MDQYKYFWQIAVFYGIINAKKTLEITEAGTEYLWQHHPSPTDQLSVPRRKGVQTFKALRHRNYRLLWISLIVSAVGTWTQIVAQSLLVLKITHNSALALGVVSLAQALSFFLFALIGGSVADRADKRRFL